MRVAVVVLVLVVTAAAHPARAGAIEGRVAPSQHVVLDTIPPTFQRATYADRIGWFRFGQLEPGWYRLEVTTNSVTTIHHIHVSSQDATVVTSRRSSICARCYASAVELANDHAVCRRLQRAR